MSDATNNGGTDESILDLPAGNGTWSMGVPEALDGKLPWSEPNSDPLRDLRDFLRREHERGQSRNFEVLLPVHVVCTCIVMSGGVRSPNPNCEFHRDLNRPRSLFNVPMQSVVGPMRNIPADNVLN